VIEVVGGKKRGLGEGESNTFSLNTNEKGEVFANVGKTEYRTKAKPKSCPDRNRRRSSLQGTSFSRSPIN